MDEGVKNLCVKAFRLATDGSTDTGKCVCSSDHEYWVESMYISLIFYIFLQLISNKCKNSYIILQALNTFVSPQGARRRVHCTQGVIQWFLDMSLTSETSCSSAEAVFSRMNEVLEGDNIPWVNCGALAVDNASVNLGIRNSIKSRVLDQYPFICILGCCCHIVHNNTCAGGSVYSKVMALQSQCSAFAIS